MKITVASIALLGLPTALAAAAPAHEVHTSPSTTLSVINTFTNHHHTTPSSSAAAASSSSLSSSSSSSAPSSTITKLAEFTIDNLVWTITSAAGVEAVDGKTLASGGEINIAGHDISDGPKGVVVDGQTLSFTKYVASSTSSLAPVGGGSSSAAAGSSAGASSATAGGSSSSSSTGGMAKVTAGVGAVVGAVVMGAMVL